MKRFHHDGAWLRKVTDAASVPPWLSLASLVGKQGAAAGIGHAEQWNILTVQETGTENSRKCMWRHALRPLYSPPLGGTPSAPSKERDPGAREHPLDERGDGDQGARGRPLDECRNGETQGPEGPPSRGHALSPPLQPPLEATPSAPSRGHALSPLYSPPLEATPSAPSRGHALSPLYSPPLEATPSAPSRGHALSPLYSPPLEATPSAPSRGHALSPLYSPPLKATPSAPSTAPLYKQPPLEATPSAPSTAPSTALSMGPSAASGALRPPLYSPLWDPAAPPL
ncbi:unnamed protein product [Boreogadus saida]